MVEVFKTDVNNQEDAAQVISALQVILPSAKINFDLEDCDKILRIENQTININTIEKKLKELNCTFELLK